MFHTIKKNRRDKKVVCLCFKFFCSLISKAVVFTREIMNHNNFLQNFKCVKYEPLWRYQPKRKSRFLYFVYEYLATYGFFQKTLWWFCGAFIIAQHSDNLTNLISLTYSFQDLNSVQRMVNQPKCWTLLIAH